MMRNNDSFYRLVSDELIVIGSLYTVEIDYTDVVSTKTSAYARLGPENHVNSLVIMISITDSC